MATASCGNCKSVLDPSKKDEHGQHHKHYRTPEVADDSDGSRIWKKKKLGSSLHWNAHISP